MSDEMRESSQLTARDIQNQQFKRGLRGYDTDEVDLFLRSVADHVERLVLAHGDLREEVGRMKGELDGLRERERMLQETLISAQKMAEQTAEAAKCEADLLIKEARIKAERQIERARDEVARLDEDKQRLQLERESFERSLRSLIDQHTRLLDMRAAERDDAENVHVFRPASSTDAG